MRSVNLEQRVCAPFNPDPLEQTEKQVLPGIDLTNCESEPIHIPGSIQPHGWLVAVSPADLRIIAISGNAASFLNIEADAAIGSHLKDLDVGTDRIPLGEKLAVAIRASDGKPITATEPIRFRSGAKAYNAVIHQHDGAMIIEIEEASTSMGPLAIQQVMLQAFAKFQSIHSMQALLDQAVEYVHQITGYDRVMIYRFHPDWHGEVVAEVKRPEHEPMMGLHFPATDIPEQARRLYQINTIRQIADVHARTWPIVPTLRADARRPLDLTHSALRAVSPVHIEYLRNMGVGASLSISLIYRGKLWGLIACHHNSSRFVDHDARMTCKFIGQMLSASLEHRHDAEERDRSQKVQERTMQLHQLMMRERSVADALTKDENTLLQLVKAEGAALIFEEKVHRIGAAPDEGTIGIITSWMRAEKVPAVFRTTELPRIIPEIADRKGMPAGLLAITLSQELGEYILWFKPETLAQVHWAGAPEKSITTTLNGQGQPTLGPRKSFAKWTEQVKGTSTPWTRADLSIAQKLREDVLQVIARNANEIRKLNEKLRVAYEELDTFSYTISHDLRTPLSAIRNYAEYLLMVYRDKVEGDLDDVLERMIRSTDKMFTLIEEVLDYSRLGRTELSGGPVDMAVMLKEIKDEVLSSWSDGRTTLTIGATPPLWGDRTMIAQVFTNLISNAVKYSQRTGSPQVHVEGSENDDEVIYTVQDNGIGIDMEQAAHVFDLFKRLDNVKGFEGSGVGLSIVKRIVEKHQGKIWLNSEPGEGSVFHVSFPKPVEV